MSEDLTTRPTMETVLERLNALGEQVNSLGEKFGSFREEIKTEFGSFREKVDIRLDRVESLTHLTHSEMLALRADFKEIQAHIRQTT